MVWRELLTHPLLTLGLLSAGLLGYALLERRAVQHESAMLAYFKTQQQLNDSTAARTAARSLEHEHELMGLVAAAKQLGGKLVAGIAINVPRRDTVLVHDTLATERAADSSRSASFRDSTFAGVITTTVTAPPFPAPLGARTTVARLAFRPEVGFVKVGTGYIATVVWNGERFQAQAPFFEEPKQPVKHVLPYVSTLLGGPANAQAGLDLHLGDLQVGPAVELRGGAWTPGVHARWQF